MKKLFTLLVIVAFTLSVNAQPPNKMSYQSVLRDNSGTLVTNQAVGMKISILQGSATGNVVFSETYSPNPQTNANGLITVEIGGGTATVGSFSGINWTSGTYYLKTETDPSGGTNYSIVGTSQLLSVPYAMHAKTVETLAAESDPLFSASPASGITVGNTTNWNTAYGWGNHSGLYRPASWVPSWADVTGKPAFATVATSGSFADLLSKPTTLAGYGITDADNSNTNEIQTLNLSGTQLTLSLGGGTVTLPSSGGGDNWGTQVVVSDATLAGNGTTATPLRIADNGVTSAKLASMGAIAGQVLKWSGTAWSPAADETGSGGSNPTGPAGGDLAGTYPDPLIGESKVTSAKIADGAVATVDLANNSVTSAKIVDGTITSSDIGNNAINSTKIQDGSVVTADLANNTVSTDKLGSLAVSTDKIQGGAVTTLKIADGAVTKAKLSATGGTNGQVLKLSDGVLEWSADNIGGLTLPYSGSVSTSGSTDLFYVNNTGTGRAIHAVAPGNTAIWGQTTSGYAAVDGRNTSGYGITGHSELSYGVYGRSTSSHGVYGKAASSTGCGVCGESELDDGTGVYGTGETGVLGSTLQSSGAAIRGECLNSNGYSGYFRGGRFCIFGNTGIGTINPTQELDVDGNARFRSIASDAYYGVLNRKQDGTLTIATSDIYFKDNIQPLQKSLDKIMQLRGVSFTWKSNPEYGIRIGFIAQEFEKVIPELVFTNEADNYKGINYAEVSAILVEAIKEQQQQIEEQQNQIDELRQLVKSLIQK